MQFIPLFHPYKIWVSYILLPEFIERNLFFLREKWHYAIEFEEIARKYLELTL